MIESKKTFCRFCHVFCGMEVDVDDGRVVAVRGDRDNPITRGYTCQKGRAEIERLYHPDRLLHPLARTDAGFEARKPWEALDEVAAALRGIIEEHGPDSVAVYVGCGGHRTSAAGPWFIARWLQALGSTRLYTSFTIDSPSLAVAGERLFGGPFPAAILDVDRSEVALFVGTNPIASHQLNMPQSSPSARLGAARRRGMTILVIDPRRSDVARLADLHLQVRPGEDPTLLAGMVKSILDRGLHDREYCAAFTSGLDALHEAVAPFDLETVERRAGVPRGDVEEAAYLFATAATGGATSGTGLHMAPRHNLATQLVMTLNAICGRIDRPGGIARSEGPLGRRFGSEMGPLPRPPQRAKSRIRGISAYNGLFGAYQEMPTNTLADEILTPGAGRIRALIVHGGNPALVFVDEARTREALADLDLLVVNDLFLSATARHADYVFAVKHPFERADVTKLMDATYPDPYGQYTEPLVEAPEGVLEEWEIFFELARRLELPLRFGGLDASRPVTTDDVLGALFHRARVPLEEIKRHPSGAIFGDPGLATGGVLPNMIAYEDRRIAVGHPAVIAELREVAAEPFGDAGGYAGDAPHAFRLITYRTKEVYCSQGHDLPSLAAKRPYNPALLHADAMARLGLQSGDRVEIESPHGRVEAIVHASDDVAPDVVALAFGWGDPLDPRGVEAKGCNVQRLIRADEAYDAVTGLARQSAIPVNVSASG
jgi:anaerobic selenocysteine-containing dehydrogenase